VPGEPIPGDAPKTPLFIGFALLLAIGSFGFAFLEAFDLSAGAWEPDFLDRFGNWFLLVSVVAIALVVVVALVLCRLPPADPRRSLRASVSVRLAAASPVRRTAARTVHGPHTRGSRAPLRTGPAGRRRAGPRDRRQGPVLPLSRHGPRHAAKRRPHDRTRRLRGGGRGQRLGQDHPVQDVQRPGPALLERRLRRLRARAGGRYLGLQRRGALQPCRLRLPGLPEPAGAAYGLGRGLLRPPVLRARVSLRAHR